LLKKIHTSNLLLTFPLIFDLWISMFKCCSVPLSLPLLFLSNILYNFCEINSKNVNFFEKQGNLFLRHWCPTRHIFVESAKSLCIYCSCHYVHMYQVSWWCDFIFIEKSLHKGKSEVWWRNNCTNWRTDQKSICPPTKLAGHKNHTDESL
jgi:hypothetical protein